jgi:hypothetical protein
LNIATVKLDLVFGALFCPSINSGLRKGKRVFEH